MDVHFYLKDNDLVHGTDNTPIYKELSSLNNNYFIFDLQDAYLQGVHAIRRDNKILIDVNINNQKPLMIKPF